VPNRSEQWSDVQVAGHTCQLFEPGKSSEHGYTVLYLHGSHLERLADHPRVVREFEKHGLRVVAPLTGLSWWADRKSPDFDPDISAEEYLLQHVLPFLREHWQCEPPQIGLMGVSMGGQGALRLAYKHPKTFPVVSAICPAVDFQQKIEEGDPVLSRMYDDPESGRQDTATLHIHPLNWPQHQWFCCDPEDLRWWESADRLRMKLSSLGVPFECDLETQAGGHTWKYFARMAIPAVDFLANRLERERLRIV